MTNFRSPGAQSLPPVVKNIIIINVLMVLLQMALAQRGVNLADYLGLHYFTSPKFHWWQLFTHMFMHGEYNDIGLTITHIFFNMYGVYMFGVILEQIWGPQRFLIFYLICGLGAAFCQIGVYAFEFMPLHADFLAYQQHPGYNEFIQFLQKHHLTGNIRQEFLTQWSLVKDDPEFARASVQAIDQFYRVITDSQMVGASGAVFGILFAFGYLFPNTPLMIMFIPVPIKAKWLIGGYALVELFMGFGQFKGDDVAHFAHIGGMIFAFILLRMWKTDRSRFY